MTWAWYRKALHEQQAIAELLAGSVFTLSLHTCTLWRELPEWGEQVPASPSCRGGSNSTLDKLYSGLVAARCKFMDSSSMSSSSPIHR